MENPAGMAVEVCTKGSPCHLIGSFIPTTFRDLFNTRQANVETILASVLEYSPNAFDGPQLIQFRGSYSRRNREIDSRRQGDVKIEKLILDISNLQDSCLFFERNIQSTNPSPTNSH